MTDNKELLSHKGQTNTNFGAVSARSQSTEVINKDGVRTWKDGEGYVNGTKKDTDTVVLVHKKNSSIEVNTGAPKMATNVSFHGSKQ